VGGSACTLLRHAPGRLDVIHRLVRECRSCRIMARIGSYLVIDLRRTMAERGDDVLRI
jgi:hypothetical protein